MKLKNPQSSIQSSMTTCTAAEARREGPACHETMNSAGNGTPVKVGSLFAGIGGFCRAFIEAGATVVWANEKDKFAAETFRLNYPNVRCLNKPIEELTVLGDCLEEVDVLTAGFPCQPFSIAGERRGLKDERGQF